MKYTPDPLLSSDPVGITEYLVREFNKLALVLDKLEATNINYGRETINTASTATTVINWKAGQKQMVEMNASTTFTFNAPEGVCNLMLRIVYNGSYTPTFPSSIKWQGGTTPTWSAANTKVDVIAMYYDGTNYHATASLDSK